MSVKTITLKELHFKNCDIDFPTIALIAPRRSGKSWTALSIASEFDIPRWSVFSGSKASASFFETVLESKATIFEANDKGIEQLSKLIYYQEMKVGIYKMRKQKFPKKYNMGIIIDDCTSWHKFRTNKYLERLFSNGRHAHILIIITVQYQKHLPPSLRTNIDFLFMLRNPKNGIKKIFEEWIDACENYHIFKQLIYKVTGKKSRTGEKLYNSLVQQSGVGVEMEEAFFVYRMQKDFDPSKIRLGDEKWRNWNKQNYNDLQLQMYLKKEKEMRQKRKDFNLIQKPQRYDEDEEEIIQLNDKNKTINITIKKENSSFRNKFMTTNSQNSISNTPILLF